MFTNIELDIFLKEKDISLREIFAFFEKEGLDVKINFVKRYDSWDFTNETELDSRFLENDQDDIFVTKLTWVDFLLNSAFMCTLFASRLEGYVNVSLGLRTQSLRGYVDDENSFIRKLLEKVASIIDENFYDKNLGEFFIAASMGIEYFVEFDADIMRMIDSASGVIMWILPTKIGKSIEIKKFEKREKNTIMVFTLTNATYKFN